MTRVYNLGPGFRMSKSVVRPGIWMAEDSRGNSIISVEGSDKAHATLRAFVHFFNHPPAEDFLDFPARLWSFVRWMDGGCIVRPFTQDDYDRAVPGPPIEYLIPRKTKQWRLCALLLVFGVFLSTFI
jgi:hypothetical protein